MTRRAASPAQLNLSFPEPPRSRVRAARPRVELVDGHRHRRAPRGHVFGAGLFAGTTAEWARACVSTKRQRDRYGAWAAPREAAGMFAPRPMGDAGKAPPEPETDGPRYVCWNGCGTRLPERGACGRCG